MTLEMLYDPSCRPENLSRKPDSGKRPEPRRVEGDTSITDSIDPDEHADTGRQYCWKCASSGFLTWSKPVDTQQQIGAQADNQPPDGVVNGSGPEPGAISGPGIVLSRFAFLHSAGPRLLCRCWLRGPS